MAIISLKNHIIKLKKKEKEFPKKLKAMALEIVGMFKKNIPDEITPKTKGKEGKTLFDKGTGQKSINYDKNKLPKGLIVVGNWKKYMGAHLTGVKKTVGIKAHTRKLKNGTVQKVGSHQRKMDLPVRNWLKKPKNLDLIVRAWQKELFK